MPGARNRSFRMGDHSELIAECVFNMLASTTRVPRQEDIGADLLCNFLFPESHSGLLIAGPSFTVQVKSNIQPIVYKQQHEVSWIRDQRVPFIIAVVNREHLQVDLYSTWKLTHATLERHADIVKLKMSTSTRSRKCESIKFENEHGKNKQTISLDWPILRLSLPDLIQSAKALKDAQENLLQWVHFDQENIDRKRVGLHLLKGLTTYEINKPIANEPPYTNVYFNVKNVSACKNNMGRAAVELAKSIQRMNADSRSQKDNWLCELIADVMSALDGEIEPDIMRLYRLA